MFQEEDDSITMPLIKFVTRPLGAAKLKRNEISLLSGGFLL